MFCVLTRLNHLAKSITILSALPLQIVFIRGQYSVTLKRTFVLNLLLVVFVRDEVYAR